MSLRQLVLTPALPAFVEIFLFLHSPPYRCRSGLPSSAGPKANIPEHMAYLTDAARQIFPTFALLYDTVKSFNLPNFLGAQITVPSELNIRQWEAELANYHDREICHFLRCGWPVGYHLDKPPASVQENHATARMHDSHIKHFIQTELAHKAVVGPFLSPPFQPWL